MDTGSSTSGVTRDSKLAPFGNSRESVTPTHRNSQFGLMSISAPSAPSNCWPNKKRPVQPKVKRISICSSASGGGVTSGGGAGSLPCGAPPHRERNGWQIKHCKVLDRVANLFNCSFMSDIVFCFGSAVIRSHCFMLATASPVFFARLFERESWGAGGMTVQQRGRARISVLTDGTHTPGSGAGSVVGGSVYGSVCGGVGSTGSPLKVVIEDYSYDDFFEFLRFVYTDDVCITLANVTALIFMADEFKVAGLLQRCLQFLRSEIHGGSVLRVLAVLRSLMQKATVFLWREVVERNKAITNFKKMTLAQRTERMDELIQTASPSVLSRPPSARSSISYASYRSDMNDRNQQNWDTQSQSSHRTARSYRSCTEYGNFQGSIGEFYPELHDAGHAYKLASDTNKSNLTTQSVMQFTLIVQVVEELDFDCWKCIRECTDSVIVGTTWLEQSLAMVRSILKQEMVNVPEIVLFRAMHAWAENRCKDRGLSLIPEHLKLVLNDTISMIRFPCMKLEEIQWEVVPTGLLEFEDLQQLQGCIANRDMMLGKYSGDDRFFPLKKMLHAAHQNEPSPRRSKTLFRNFTAPACSSRGGSLVSTPLAQHSSSADITNAALLPKSPTYRAACDDEIDCMLGAQLLRYYVDQLVDEHQDVMAAHDAGVPGAHTGDCTAVLVGDTGASPAGGGTESSSAAHHDKITRLSPMLMFAPSFFEGEESSAANVPCGSLDTVAHVTEPEDNYTAWGQQPAAQDFARFSQGLYRFRGHHVIEIKIEDGIAVVYEHDHGRCPSPDEDENLLQLHPEDVKEKLGLAGVDSSHGVPLTSFLCRQ